MLQVQLSSDEPTHFSVESKSDNPVIHQIINQVKILITKVSLRDVCVRALSLSLSHTHTHTHTLSLSLSLTHARTHFEQIMRNRKKRVAEEVLYELTLSKLIIMRADIRQMRVKRHLLAALAMLTQ